MRHSRTRARRSRLLTALIAVLGVAATLALPQTAIAAPVATLSLAASQTIANGIANGAVVDSAIVKTADLSKFNPGNIISDALFYDGNAMTSAEIQRFLDQKIGRCENGKCLNIQNVSISSRERRVSQVTGDLVCEAIQGGTMRASELIYRVQVACGISAKVILATLQKEQTLVTSRAPSDWNIQQAMGQACPDTAPCDPAFSGLGPQIVGGVNQLKIYKAGRFAKQPGVHYIQYNPDVRCGGTNVNIVNYATAALYNYTPYQPNASAIRAGYGEGDTCGSYGNRNFFHFYTDWFGSTQEPTGLVHVAGNVHLIAGSNAYPVGPDLIGEYRAAFGEPVSVGASYLSRFTRGNKVTPFIRNVATGMVGYLQGGQSHHFTSCAIVAAWGGACEAEVRLTASMYNSIPTGARMTLYARTEAGSRIHLIDPAAGRLIPYLDEGSVAAAAGVVNTPYAAILTPTVASGYAVAPLRFAPASFITLSGSTQVFLPSAEGRLAYLPSWSVAHELGLPSTVYRRSVDSTLVSGFSRGHELGLVVSCGARQYFASSGSLRAVSAASVQGFAVTPLDQATCAQLNIDASSELPAVLIHGRGRGDVYLAQNGVYRHVTSPAILDALGGGTRPVVLTVAPESIDRLPKGDPLLSAVSLPRGQFFTGSGSSRVYLPLSDTEAAYLPAWSISRELGLPASVSTTIGTAAMATIRQTAVLSQWVRCGTTTYVGASGILHAVQGAAAQGFDVVTLDAVTCGGLRRQTEAPLPRVLFHAAGDSAVYLSEGGVLRHVTSPAVLNRIGGGTKPPVLTISSAALARYSIGAPVTSFPG